MTELWKGSCSYIHCIYIAGPLSNFFLAFGVSKWRWYFRNSSQILFLEPWARGASSCIYYGPFRGWGGINHASLKRSQVPPLSPASSKSKMRGGESTQKPLCHSGTFWPQASATLLLFPYMHAFKLGVTCTPTVTKWMPGFNEGKVDRLPRRGQRFQEELTQFAAPLAAQGSTMPGPAPLLHCHSSVD